MQTDGHAERPSCNPVNSFFGGYDRTNHLMFPERSNSCCFLVFNDRRMNERSVGRLVGWSVSKLLGGAGSGYEFPYSILRMCWTGYQEDLYHYLHTLRRYCAPPPTKKNWSPVQVPPPLAEDWSPTHVLLKLMMIAE